MGRKYRRKGMTIGGFDPALGERLAPAWYAMEAAMADGEWHYRDELVEVGMGASDLIKVTCQKMLSKMSAPDGPVDRRGSVKTRRYRLKVE